MYYCFADIFPDASGQVLPYLNFVLRGGPVVSGHAQVM